MNFTDSILEFNFNQKPFVLYQIQNGIATKFESYLKGEITFRGSFGVLDIAAGLSGELDCNLKLPKVDYSTNIAIAPITVGFGITPLVGIKTQLAYTGGAVKVTGPKIESGIRNYRYGFGYNSTQGSYSIKEGQRFFTLDAFSLPQAPSITSELTASLSPYLKLLADVNFGVGFGAFDVDFISIDFLSMELYGKTETKIPTPLSIQQRTYKGPSWTSKAGFNVKLESGVSLGDFEQFLSRRFKFSFNLAQTSFTLMKFEGLVDSSVPPILTPSTTTVTNSVNLTAQMQLDILEPGAEAEFWRFKQGEPTGVRIGQRVPLDANGNASITWTPSSTDNGTYEIKAYVFQSPFGGINLPYASTPVNIDVNVTQQGGELDPSFNGNGFVITGFTNSNSESAYAITSYDGNKILVAGTTYSEFDLSGKIALARYNSNGSLDTTFGNGGKVTTDFGGNFSSSAYSMTVDSNGKILVAGSTRPSGNSTFHHVALARYNS